MWLHAGAFRSVSSKLMRMLLLHIVLVVIAVTVHSQWYHDQILPDSLPPSMAKKIAVPLSAGVYTVPDMRWTV